MTATADPSVSADDSSSLLARRPYVLFLAGRFLGTLATGSQAVVIAWEVYEVARRAMSIAEAAFVVGMIGLAQFLPLFALTLIAGEVADRHDRRRILALCYLAQFMTSVLLAARSSFGGGGVWPIFVLAALFGCSRAFFQPTASALGPMLVPLRLLPRAIATNSLAAQLASILGPALGGLLCVVSPILGYTARGLCGAGSPWCLGPAHPTGNRGGSVAGRPDPRGAGIRVGKQACFGRDLARPVRGTPRRSDGTATRIRQRRTQNRTAGVRRAASVSRGWRPDRGRISGVSVIRAPRRARRYAGGRPVRTDDRRVCLFSMGPSFHARARGAGWRRHGVGVYPPEPGSDRHSRPHAGAGVGRIDSIHRGVERAGRI